MTEPVRADSAPRLPDRRRIEARRRHLSRRTEEACALWARRFVLFHGRRHPRELGAAEVAAFLTHLAVEHRVAAATRARRPRRLPVVLSRDEARRLLAAMVGVEGLVATLLYGGGLRLHEALPLRVKDLDFERGEITVRSGKGDRDRRTMLPGSTIEPLRLQLERARILHAQDLERGLAEVDLPGALARKLRGAAREWVWQWVFPAPRLCEHPLTGGLCRHHLYPQRVQRAVSRAARAAGIPKRVTCRTLRHSFATHVLEAGYDIRTMQELLGHRQVSTTMVYTHVLNRGGLGVKSPLDRTD